MNNLQNKDPLNQSYQTSIPSEVSLVTVPHDDSMANFLQNNSEVDPFFVDNSKESITFNLTKFNDFLDKIKISKSSICQTNFFLNQQYMMLMLLKQKKSFEIRLLFTNVT